ncbi:MAG: CDP-diacylglycerol--glycerol-3-phosphate 3-phosphatidyltransferase [Pseudohongiellaceae bacterium]|jgi:CDP-diacylglycerol--glycerol-3-phosphate 3-phosphatidyltransferase
MNLPNKITMSRFFVAILLFGFLVWTNTCSGPEWWIPALAATVFLLAVVTDALDGYYARKLGQQSDFGRIADPVVDKIIVCGAFVFLISVDWARVYIGVWMAVVMIGREFLVSGLRGYIESRGVAFPSRWDGKLKMVMQCVAVPAVLVVRAIDLSLGQEYPAVLSFFIWLAHISVWATFVMTMISGARYVSAAADVLRGSDGQA